jgi:Ca2+:H+ antiporter
MYLLFQLKSHAYMYESTPQHIIDEESAPGPVANWLDSSDSDSDSSSSSDSDGSNESNTTAKKIKRAVMRGGRRRRKSSAGSKEAADVDTVRTRTSSLGTNSSSPKYTDTFTDDHPPLFTSPGSHLGPADAIENDDNEKRGDRSYKGSVRGRHRKERKKERKRREKRERRAQRMEQAAPISEVVVQDHPEVEVEIPGSEPRRVDFALTDPSVPSESDARGRLPFLRGMRPQMPKTLSQNVFSSSPAPPQLTGSIPRIRYGIRRTNSLPDRLNQTYRDPVGAPAAGGPPILLNRTTMTSTAVPHDDENISRTAAVILLLISTGLVAVCAEFMVDSINAVVSGNSGISEMFIGLIILPIVGNASEHVTSVTVATKNKMDLAIGVAVGSSIQIGMFLS